MSIFEKILEKIGLKKDTPDKADQPAGTTARTGTTEMSRVDVNEKLEQRAAGSGLNWKTSIVDLLKLLDIDSSYEARVELAKELGAPAEVMDESVEMNTWLHKEVMRRIAANGGNVPRELLA